MSAQKKEEKKDRKKKVKKNSDESDILDIRPNQFEPLNVNNNQEESLNSSSEESDVNDINVSADRLVDTDWCDCGNCESMATSDECVCCSDISAVNYLIQPDDLNCITEHQVFISNCLNRHALRLSMYEYMDNTGPFDDNEPTNEKYRFMAYRRFVQWIWHYLGRHNRKVLPACVVTKIRAISHQRNIVDSSTQECKSFEQ